MIKKVDGPGDVFRIVTSVWVGLTCAAYIAASLYFGSFTGSASRVLFLMFGAAPIVIFSSLWINEWRSRSREDR